VSTVPINDHVIRKSFSVYAKSPTHSWSLQESFRAVNRISGTLLKFRYCFTKVTICNFTPQDPLSDLWASFE
jgi:hypothetical protein